VSVEFPSKHTSLFRLVVIASKATSTDTRFPQALLSDSPDTLGSTTMAIATVVIASSSMSTERVEA
jgi:hypothetical protein